VQVFHEDGSTQLQLRVPKPLELVAESDVKASVLAALAASHGGTVGGAGGAHGSAAAAAALLPCGCCDGNLEKQRGGCNCCGFVLREASDAATPVVAGANTSEAAATDAADATAAAVNDSWNSEAEKEVHVRLLSEAGAKPTVLPPPRTITVTVKALVGGAAWPVTLPASSQVRHGGGGGIQGGSRTAT
jgi:hypothetical protein